MELDELKTTWMALETQLKKNESLNKKLLLEMLQKKSSKSLGKLLNYDFLSVIMCLLYISCGIWLYDINENPFLMNYLSVRILAIVLIAMSAIGLFWYCYKLKYLMKIDVAKSVKDNVFCVTKYDTMIKQEKVANYCIMLPVAFLLCAFCYYEFSMGISSWTFLILPWTFLIVAMTIGIALTIWMYKKIYDPNIQAIKKGLNELKELNETVDGD